jgi:hypothetical protein
MIHELRVYRALPGRFGPMVARFGTLVIPMWKRFGIRPAGFWTTVIGESSQELFYMLEWESLAERETKWAAFLADPEWIAKLKESEADGPMIANIANTILSPVDFGSGG